jgi:hypothetical protein
LASPGAATDGDAADPGGTGLSVARARVREGAATGGTSDRAGIPDPRPPVHIIVLADEACLFAPKPPATGATVTTALPHTWQRLTGHVVPGLGAGSGA